MVSGIQKLLAQPLSEAQKVIVEASRIAHSDVRKLYDADGRLLAGAAISDVIAPAVSSVKQTVRRKGVDEVEVTNEFRLWDKNSAIGFLGKVHKVAAEQLEVNTTYGEKTPEEVGRLSDEELRAELIRVTKLRIQEAQDELDRLERGLAS